MATVPISYLRDNFNNVAGAFAWGAAYETGSATVSEASGKFVVTLPSSTAGVHEAAYRTGGTYDITGDGCFINIDTMVATGVAAYAFFTLLYDPNNSVRWFQQSNSVKAQKVIAGVVTDLFTATWSAVTYKYLRITEAGGTITYWSSTNGTSWTSRATLANPFAVTALVVLFGAGCGNVASPGTFKLDDFNPILPALTTNWHWIQVEWPLLYRYRSVSLAATSGQGYIAVSNDGTTWTYYSGPIGSLSGGYNSLSPQSTQADAQAMAVNLPLNDRWDLPVIVETRFIRLYHRSITGSSYTVREYYPRRLVQSDDVEAESIQAINIAAQAITADKIFVVSLSAITASMGSLTMDGPIDITTGSIIGGGGKVTLGAQGLAVEISSSVLAPQSYQFVNSSAVLQSSMQGTTTASSTMIRVTTESIAGKDSTAYLQATAPSGRFSGAHVWATNGSAVAALDVNVSTGGTPSISLGDNTTDVSIGKGLTVGTATVAATGQISTSGNAGFGANAASTIRLYSKGVDATSSNYGLYVENSASALCFYVRNDGAVIISKSGATTGFYGSGGGGKPTITGAKAGNAALTSLLSALATLGLLTDSST